jgi:carbon storage regulator
MLFLTRKIGQAVIINDCIEVTVVEITGKAVKLGFNFPPTETVLRQELFEKIKAENTEAAKALLPTHALSLDASTLLSGMAQAALQSLKATDETESVDGAKDRDPYQTDTHSDS